MNIWNEIRILYAECLLHLAGFVMPRDEPEAKPLQDALDGYFRESAQHARWARFPA